MSSEIGAPPLLVIGMEGFWGSLVCVLGVYPVMMVAGIEDPYDTYVMMSNSAEIRSTFLAYFLFIFLYNLLAVLVTFMLNSVWHAILDNFRPITVWGTDLFIFYMITDTFGEVRARGPGVGRVKKGVGGFTTREARSIRRRRAFDELRARGPCRGRRIGWLSPLGWRHPAEVSVLTVNTAPTRAFVRRLGVGHARQRRAARRPLRAALRHRRLQRERPVAVRWRARRRAARREGRGPRRAQVAADDALAARLGRDRRAHPRQLGHA